jgi:hypothetical protein
MRGFKFQCIFWVFSISACSSLNSFPPATAPAATAPIFSCLITKGYPAEKELIAMATLRQSIESGPFYLIPTFNQKNTSCSAEFTQNGNIVVNYKFAHQQWLAVEHNPYIAYTAQTARINIPSHHNAEALLRQTEKTMFGEPGCRIEWAQPSNALSAANANLIDTVFRGDICSCQARIQRTRTGQVTELGLKSSC